MWADPRLETNEEFIDFCYKTILKRAPDNEGKLHYVNALGSDLLTREGVLLKFLTSEEYESRTGAQEFVPPGHYYSAIPSAKDRECFLSSVSMIDKALGINVNEQKQIDLLHRFKKFYDECPFPEHKTDQFRYYFSNQSYAHTDALTLYSMIRHFEPKRIIEVGSGYSSCVMLDTDECFLNSEIRFIFIEPYPELLHSLLREGDKKHNIIPMRLQDIDMEIFRSLEENDILFIDSTHVSKINSDVNKIFFEILPSLQRGVVIHFHDIFWPFEYPMDWIREGRAWNEAYILRAFLEFNDSFEIIFFSSYLHNYHQEFLRNNMPLYLKNAGGNIWIKKWLNMDSGRLREASSTGG